MTAPGSDELVVVRVPPALAATLATDREVLDDIADRLAGREPVLFQFDDAPGEHFDAAVAAAVLLRKLTNAWFAITTDEVAGSGHPYNLARRILSLEQLSAGRIAWVHGLDAAPDFVTVVQQLWRSWPRESLATDAEAPHFADVSGIRRIGADGAFAVAGPLNVPSSPQYLPVVVAPTSAPGAHRYTDLVVGEEQWMLPGTDTPIAHVVEAADLAALHEIAHSLPTATRAPQTLRERLELPVPTLVELATASARFDVTGAAEAS